MLEEVFGRIVVEKDVWVVFCKEVVEWVRGYFGLFEGGR